MLNISIRRVIHIQRFIHLCGDRRWKLFSILRNALWNIRKREKEWPQINRWYIVQYNKFPLSAIASKQVVFSCLFNQNALKIYIIVFYHDEWWESFFVSRGLGEIRSIIFFTFSINSDSFSGGKSVTGTPLELQCCFWSFFCFLLISDETLVEKKTEEKERIESRDWRKKKQ